MAHISRGTFWAMPWEPENRDGAPHRRFVNNTKTHAKDIDVVFYGDSITAQWLNSGEKFWAKHYTPLHAVNYGIGGDTTQCLLWRIQHGEVEGLDPKVVVLMIGTNNLRYNTDSDIAKGIKAVIDLLLSKLPKTKILLLGILPCYSHISNVKHINSTISSYDNTDSIRFLDMTSAFADSSGNIKSNLYRDGVHLSTAGYEVWAETMNPLLKQMLTEQ